jgi:hypothetical protein
MNRPHYNKKIEFRKYNFYKYFPEFSWDKDKLIEMKLLDNELNKPFNWKGKKQIY